MRALPSSPRQRKRALLGAGLVAAGGVVAAVVVMLPSRSTPADTTASPPTVPPTSVTGAGRTTAAPARLTATERRQIEGVVDRFARAALDRSNPRLAWELAGPDLRGTSGASDWTSEQMPVQVYPAKDSTFHGWQNVEVGRDSVVFDLVVQPRPGAKVGPVSYSVEVIKRGTSWAVNRWYTAATFTPVGDKHPRIQGPNDYGAGPGTLAEKPNTGTGVLGGPWIIGPVLIFVLGALSVILLMSRNWLRFRRVRRSMPERSELPPLPRGRRY